MAGHWTPNEARHFVEERRNITTGGSPVTPLYDHNGNLTDDDKDYVYEYDAWNRLTSISTTGGPPTLVAEYRYNGLGHRIAEGDGTDTEYLIYDDRWRLISRHDGTSAYLEETLPRTQRERASLPHPFKSIQISTAVSGTGNAISSR